MEVKKMYVEYNPNPKGKYVDDCVIRAITKVLGIDWDTAFLSVVMVAFSEKNMPSINGIWEQFLINKGFTRSVIIDTCPHCYTVRDFTNDHPKGVYILATGTHVVAVVDGNYYDTWDSGDEIPIYYFERRLD